MYTYTYKCTNHPYKYMWYIQLHCLHLSDAFCGYISIQNASAYIILYNREPLTISTNIKANV